MNRIGKRLTAILCLISLGFLLLKNILDIQIPYLNIYPIFVDRFVITCIIIFAALGFSRIKPYLFFALLGAASLEFLTEDAVPYSFLSLALLIAPKFNIQNVKILLQTGVTRIERIFNDRFWLALPAVISVIVFIFYKQGFLSYFEGDEWIFIRAFTNSTRSEAWFIQGFIDTFTINAPILHAAPIANMLYVIEYALFGLNFTQYYLVAVLTHILVSISLGYFVFLLSKSRKLSLISALVFASLASHAQAITWTLGSLFTGTAQLFSFLCVIFFVRFIHNKKTGYLALSALFLMLGLLSKETALSCIPLLLYLYIFLTPASRRQLRDIRWHFLVFVLFVMTQLAFRNHSDLEKFFNPAKYIINYLILTSKAYSQGILAAEPIKNLSILVTDYQFPFFNQEKEVGGTTYLMFIQGAAFEFLSHILTLILVIASYLLLQAKKHVKARNVAIIMFFAGTLPLTFISFQFPWWQYQAIVDSRHLYSITPSISIIIALIFIQVSSLFQRYIPINSNKILVFLVVVFMLSQYSLVQSFILSLQKNTHLQERKTIVKSLQDSIMYPPKKMLIYTQSSQTYYGFSHLILPFQTAFSQIIPIIFDQHNHVNGHAYPSSFYSKGFIDDSGIVSEGYFEDAGYGIGYFLDENELIKTLEKTGLPLTSVFAYQFDHENNQLHDTTTKMREKVDEKLESRKIFSNWKKYGSEEEHFSFLSSPDWNVHIETNQSKRNVYTIYESKTGMITKIEVIDPPHGANFSPFVSDQTIDGSRIGNKYETFQLIVDLDMPRTAIRSSEFPNIFYLVAGNNLMYYKITVNDDMKAALIFRTFEFID